MSHLTTLEKKTQKEKNIMSEAIYAIRNTRYMIAEIFTK